MLKIQRNYFENRSHGKMDICLSSLKMCLATWLASNCIHYCPWTVAVNAQAYSKAAQRNKSV